LLKQAGSVGRLNSAPVLPGHALDFGRASAQELWRSGSKAALFFRMRPGGLPKVRFTVVDTRALRAR
jgi:hypothetical protein